MFSKNIILFSLMMIIYSSNILLSQNICPPDTGTNCTPWTISTYQTSTDHPDCILTVIYKWRSCNNNYQVYIENYFSQGNCTILEQNATTFQEWLNLLIIEELANLDGQVDPPDCPASSMKAIFYSASCGLWVKCDYTVDSTTRACDVDWRGEFPDYDSGGNRKVTFWKWQLCGYTCCKKTYNVCKALNLTNGQMDLFINSVSKEKVGACSNPDNFVQPCEDGC